MRWTISRKLWLGLGLVLLVLLASSGLALSGVRATTPVFRHLSEVEQPISDAAYEMEINVIGIGGGVLEYLETQDPAFLTRVADDEGDFRRFKATYDRLAVAPEARALGGQLSILFEQYMGVGRELVAEKDRQVTQAVRLRDAVARMDAVLDDDLQAGLVGEDGPGRVKLQQAVSLESDLAEAGTWFGHYRHTRELADRERLDDNVADFRAEIEAFTALGLSADEQRAVREIEELFATTTATMSTVLAADDALLSGERRLGELREGMDAILDEGIQGLSQGSLRADEARANQALRRVSVTIGALLLVGLLAAAAAVVILTKGIVSPIRRLVEGADRIGRGDLDHEVAVCGTDEVAELAGRINRMTRRWRATELESERVRHALEDRNERLLELDRLKDDLVSLVSHEFRTPLTSIMGYTELVAEAETLTDDERRFLAIVERNAQRLLRLVGDLLVVAQIDRGELSLQRSYCDLGQLARACIETAGVKAQEKGVELLLVTESVTLSCDRARLGQVLDNFVSNAVKFTPSGGRVRVSVTQAAGHAVLEVADTGIGIPVAEQHGLFARFSRMSNATEQALPGTGLGLWISKQIIDAHRGRVSVSSTEGVGTTFRIELPTVAEQQEESGPVQQLEPCS